MRDIFVFSAILCIVLATLRKPQVGILGWLWLSIMNPHKESYGWIYSLPILDIIAAATLFSALLNTAQAKKIFFHPVTVLVFMFYFWVCASTLLATSYDLSFPRWLDYSKTMLFIFLMLLFLHEKNWIIAAIWVFVLSIAFTSVKGGIFTVLTGGGARIWGAPGTAWGDNNGVSVATLMVLPLIFALKELSDRKVFRLGVYGSTLMSFACILGTQSRGGLVGILGAGSVFFLRSRHKIIIGVFLFIIGAGVLAFMPDSWTNRMQTIQTYEKDKSASTRILQWKYATQLAAESPIIGKGFDARYYQPYYHKYLAGIDLNRAAHSNYFQVLEEQGYVGLFLFLLLMSTAVLSAHRASKKIDGIPHLAWVKSLLFYSQFGIFGYAFNGLTQNMAYLDLYYYILAFIILLINYINTELAKTDTDKAIAS